MADTSAHYLQADPGGVVEDSKKTEIQTVYSTIQYYIKYTVEYIQLPVYIKYLMMFTSSFHCHF